MKRWMVICMSLMLIMATMSMPVSAACNGYRCEIPASADRICDGTCVCCCADDRFGICDNRTLDPLCETNGRGLRGVNYVDADGDGVCDRCANRDSMPNGSATQPENGSRGNCDGTGPKGKGRGNGNGYRGGR